METDFEYNELSIVFMGYSKDKICPASDLRTLLIYNSMTNDKTDPTNYGDKVIALGNYVNGNAVRFDYRERNYDPKTVLMLHDNYEEDEQGEMKMILIPLANSFDEFIDSLPFVMRMIDVYFYLNN